MLPRDEVGMELVRHVQTYRGPGDGPPLDQLAADTHPHDVVQGMGRDAVNETTWPGPRGDDELLLGASLGRPQGLGDIVPCLGSH